MNKKDWQDGLKKLKGFLITAEQNIKTASDQKEELDFTIAAYKKKIGTFKTDK